jgi:hypothetical protein
MADECNVVPLRGFVSEQKFLCQYVYWAVAAPQDIILKDRSEISKTFGPEKLAKSL